MGFRAYFDNNKPLKWIATKLLLLRLLRSLEKLVPVVELPKLRFNSSERTSVLLLETSRVQSERARFWLSLSLKERPEGSDELIMRRSGWTHGLTRLHSFRILSLSFVLD